MGEKLKKFFKNKIVLTTITYVLAAAVVVTGVFLILDNVGDCQLSIESTKAMPGDTISVDIMIDKNPGVYVGGMYIKYNTNVFNFVSCANGEVFDQRSLNALDDGVMLIFNQTGLENTKKNGVVATINLKIKDSAPSGDYNIYFDYSDVDSTGFCNVQEPENYIKVDYKGGKITVK